MDRCFNIYGAGGAGINILNQLLKESKSQQFIKQVVGLDTSDANNHLNDFQTAFAVSAFEARPGND